MVNLALDSCAHVPGGSWAQVNPVQGSGLFVISCGELGTSLFGLQLARIRLLVVMLGLGVVSLGGAPLPHPFFFHSPEFREFFKLGWVLRTTLPTGSRRSGSSLCCLWVSLGGGGFCSA